MYNDQLVYEVVTWADSSWWVAITALKCYTKKIQKHGSMFEQLTLNLSHIWEVDIDPLSRSSHNRLCKLSLIKPICWQNMLRQYDFWESKLNTNILSVFLERGKFV